MKPINIQDALDMQPFKPFVVETDSGKKLKVIHGDFIMFSPSKGTAVIWETKEDGDHYSIVSAENISSITFPPSLQ